MALFLPIIFLIVASIGLFAFYSHNKLQNFHKSLTIPGPKPQLFWGNIRQFSTDFQTQLKNIIDTYGEPGTLLTRIFFFHAPTIVAIKADHVKQILNATSERQDAINKVHMDNFLGPKAMVSLHEDEWKFHRRIVSKAFGYAQLQALAPAFSACGQELVEALTKISSTSSINIEAYLKAVTLNVIGRTGFGYNFDAVKRMGTGVDPVAQAFEYLLAAHASRERSINPLDWFYNAPTKKNARHKAERTLLRSTLQDIITRRRKEQAEGSKQKHNDLLEYFLEAHDEDSGQKFSDYDLLDELLTMMFAGYDTTSLMLSFTLYLLNMNRDCEALLHKEAVEVLGDRLPGFDDIAKLKYTQCVLKESLRFYPPAPLTARTLQEDLELEGHIIPKGFNMFLPIYYIHTHPVNWPDEPLKFKPERFSDLESYNPAAFLPFSGGGRTCVGQKFAMNEGIIVLAMMARQFYFRVQEGFVLKTTMGIVQKPVSGLPVFVHKHKD
jgi:cytochrome P450